MNNNNDCAAEFKVDEPGKYVQRDGGVAKVADVDVSCKGNSAVVGWASDNDSCNWNIDGSRNDRGYESPLDLVSKYVEPPVAREGWGLLFDTKEAASTYFQSAGIYSGANIVHAREVLP